ncbi:MAG: Gfo/Idh/MocA family oxidoreductase [Actinobacteria bacterium]|nr:Gfo/Idh/MocA family oxidoreductase [Actinomycetota bacterium]
MTRPLGVGFIGAGPVTRAIHLPTLADLGDRLRTVAVADVDTATATAVAARCPGARACTVDELLEDPAVDVVAICSPHDVHADQAVAAIEAGKRGVLCEKPFATTVDEAQRIVDAAATASVPVVVGAMHGYDPAWVCAQSSWGDLADTATLARSTIYLPSNDEFTGLATEQPPVPGSAPAVAGPAPTAADLVRMGVLGLASHTVPHLRRFLRGVPEVVSARYVAPWGYHLVLTAEGRTGVLLALMPGEWGPGWRFEAFAPNGSLDVVYPPSYVRAGSATATLTDARGLRRSWTGPANGYRQEWLHLADVVEGRAAPLQSVADAAADLAFAVTVADGAEKILEGNA